MKEILFLTAYPTKKTLKDGMVQRVKNIDDLFTHTPRIFLDVKIRFYFSKQVCEPAEYVKEYKLNAVIHFFLIWKLIKSADIIYLHSIYGAVWTFIQLSFFKKKICLDFHGVVPEENLVINNKFYFYYFNFIERISVRLATHVIHVSKVMERNFTHKYPFITKNSMVYPNYTNIRKDHIPLDFGKKEIGSETTFIYSGNLQSWQNIDELLELIHSYQHVPHYRFIILTGKVEQFKKRILKHHIQLDRIEINSVNSDEIDQYYAKAHYGFILRSNHLLNRVANPTKMMEYLLFGITPIVKSVAIGDFNDYDYEYINVKEFNEHLLPKKSIVNQNIALKILSEKEDLVEFVKL
ncbi:glycosyltransferase [Pedobacter boryungensis]|uniref:Glycosyltransferase n=1 Tax=Pedobacter boryungensis TaxID=869962 RepID=A0ABX2DI18_9SPHI|nr:glycosyltransferase [Pedobacter boryungensis]NQX32749.1 glycosyltransferase [Pedobacter boryungensis]